MKYKVAKELIRKIKTFDDIDGDLVVFKKPFTKTIEFTMKDGDEKVIELKRCSYVSLSNHGFLFVVREPYEHITVQLNYVQDMVVI